MDIFFHKTKYLLQKLLGILRIYLNTDQNMFKVKFQVFWQFVTCFQNMLQIVEPVNGKYLQQKVGFIKC